MRDWLSTHKPAAPARWHLLLAALMWTTVGGLLAYFGARWLWHNSGVVVRVLFGAAVAAGILKSRFVLERTANRTIERIRTRGDGRCIGGFLSVRSWAFVALMMGVGRALRASPTPRTVLGFVYVAVGLALLLASRRLWLAWREQRRKDEG